jgi:2-dehydropantoate 2-reductase
MLDQPVDVIWVTTKATQLADAIERVPTGAAGSAVVVPLLNGLDHVALLRERYGDGRVLAATIAIESERPEAGFVRQLSRFATVSVAPHPRAEEIRDEVAEAGLTASVGEDEATILWGKLAILAPVALTTTLRGSDLGGVLADATWRERFEACVREVTAAARGEGVLLDADAMIAELDGIRPGLRSSMQKDREAGRPTEIDAIGGAVVRAADRQGLDVPTTRALVDNIEAGEP